MNSMQMKRHKCRETGPDEVNKSEEPKPYRNSDVTSARAQNTLAAGCDWLIEEAERHLIGWQLKRYCKLRWTTTISEMTSYSDDNNRTREDTHTVYMSRKAGYILLNIRSSMFLDELDSTLEIWNLYEQAVAAFVVWVCHISWGEQYLWRTGKATFNRTTRIEYSGTVTSLGETSTFQPFVLEFVHIHRYVFAKTNATCACFHLNYVSCLIVWFGHLTSVI